MCECLQYEDGSMYLCEVCGPMFQEKMEELEQLKATIEQQRINREVAKFYENQLKTEIERLNKELNLRG